MKLSIQKWGDSAALMLPNALLEQLGVEIGGVLDVVVTDNVAQIKASKPKYKLKELLAEMPDGFPIDIGWESMLQVGREVL